MFVHPQPGDYAHFMESVIALLFSFVTKVIGGNMRLWGEATLSQQVSNRFPAMNMTVFVEAIDLSVHD